MQTKVLYKKKAPAESRGSKNNDIFCASLRRYEPDQVQRVLALGRILSGVPRIEGAAPLSQMQFSNIPEKTARCKRLLFIKQII